MKRRLVALVAIVAAPLAVVGACTFPDVTFGPADQGGPGEAGPGDGADASASDAPSDVVIDEEDIVERGDAAIVDAAGCDATCDCDGDGYVREGCDAGEAGVDCDDLDPLRNPGQNKLVAERPDGHDGDWNCDGHVEKAFPKPASCTGVPPAIPCQGEGFTTDVPCGEARDYFRCGPSGVSCAPNIYAEAKTQACK